jgi:hypothetical protein
LPAYFNEKILHCRRAGRKIVIDIQQTVICIIKKNLIKTAIKKRYSTIYSEYETRSVRKCISI